MAARVDREDEIVPAHQGNRGIRRRDLLDIVFVVGLLGLFSIFALLFIINPTGAQANIFFNKTGDFFADCFNVMDMSSGRNPYWFGLDDPAPAEHGYPPLCYLICYFLARFNRYPELGALDAQHTTLGMTMVVLTLIVTSVVFFVLLRKAYRKSGVLGFLLPASLLLSSVFLFSVERGNMVLLAAVMLFIFILGYRSDDKVIFELSLIALAIATGLKGYPAILGLLLIFDRKYLAALRCALYAIVLIFLPFLFFIGGFSNISIWLSNISLNSQVYGADTPIFGLGLFSAGFGDPATAATVKADLDMVNKVLCVLALIGVFFMKKQWKRVLLLLLVLVCVQTNSSRYLGLYLFVGIVFFFDEEEHGGADWVYLLLFLAFLNPLQVVTSSGANLSVAMMGASVDALFVILTVESLIDATRSLRGRGGAGEGRHQVGAHGTHSAPQHME